MAINRNETISSQLDTTSDIFVNVDIREFSYLYTGSILILICIC